MDFTNCNIIFSQIRSPGLSIFMVSINPVTVRIITSFYSSVILEDSYIKNTISTKEVIITNQIKSR